jgi:nucleoside-diphosphate-sugar epimerase/predicted dehydrogenase
LAKEPRLAIIGCGTIVESAFAPALRRIGWRPSVLVDISVERTAAVARRLGLSDRRVRRSVDWRSVEPHFDAALVALPHALHGSFGVDLARSGKHVLMEKPLAVSASECRAMIEAARSAGVALRVGLLRRYLRLDGWLKALLESGELGDIRRFEVRESAVLPTEAKSDALVQPQLACGGVLLDTGAHTLDSVMGWLGELDLVSYRDDSEGGVEAHCVIECRRRLGGVGVIELSRTRALRDSIRVEGSRGFIEAHLYKNDVLAGSPNALAFRHEGLRAGDLAEQFSADLFDAELEDFKACASGNAGGIPGEEAERSVAFIERCYQERGRLELPWQAATPAGTVSKGAFGEFPQGCTVLVTGGAGFIGGRLVERLLGESGARVRCLIRDVGRATRLARLPVELIKADLADRDAVSCAMRGVDYVFHCAYDPRSASQNFDGLRNLIETAAAQRAHRLVHVSTFAVYEPFPDGPLSEETRDGDRSMVYVDRKLKLEELAFELGARARLPVAVIQPSIVYGPFCNFWTKDVADMLISGRVVLPLPGDGLCNAVFVDDLTEGLALAGLRAAAAGERFILSGPGAITWREFYEAFARALGADPPLYWPPRRIASSNNGLISTLRRTAADPRHAIRKLVRWNSAREILQRGVDSMPELVRRRIMSIYFSTERRIGSLHIPDPASLARLSSKAVLDSGKARRLLGYRPRIEFAEGMSLTARYLEWAYADVPRRPRGGDRPPSSTGKL